MIISRCFIPGMRNVPDLGCRENQKKPFIFNKFFPEIYAAYEVMCKNILKPDRPPMTIYKEMRRKRNETDIPVN
jgi:hypothetical protein